MSSEIWTLVLYSVVSCLIGAIIARIRTRGTGIDGELKIEQFEEEDGISEKYSLDFLTSLDDIPKKKNIVLRVKVTTSRKNLSL